MARTSVNCSEERVVRVVPDLPAVDRAFDYLVPDALAGELVVGTIVRVPLHGRRVRGWVLDADVEPEVPRSELRPLRAVVSAGPPADVVELCRWTAWRYAGPLALVLRSASPANLVPATRVREPAAAVFPAAPLPAELEPARDRDHGLIAWPPATARTVVVLGLLADEGSTIVVAPDASEVEELRRALERTGRVVVVLRGDASAAERTRAWDTARAGACVVLGARLAVLAPVPDLCAVILLDEGDEALKEERAPTWSARELAMERGRRVGARVTMLTPTPTVEAEVEAGPVVRPTRGTERAGWPRLMVVDRRDAAPGRSVLSDELADAMRAVLDAGSRVVCVLNRRGRARLSTCRACGSIAQCERCRAAVAESEAGFRCPRCGAERPRICLRCHATRFGARRAGVTRMREEVEGLLPRASVTEVSADATDLAGDVLVGTESVLHQARAARLRAGLVAFLDFDLEQLAPRYRASEQALWLLVRAARLVGGREAPGRVLVQTRVPDHEVLDAARTGDFDLVALPDRARREELGFPPFGGLAELSGGVDAVTEACVALRAADALVVSGPNVSGASATALVQAATPEVLADALAGIDLGPARARGRVRLEVDPLRV